MIDDTVSGGAHDTQNMLVATATLCGRVAYFLKRYASTAALVLLTYFGMTGASKAGSGFSEQGNALSKALNAHLISVGICKDFQTCQKSLRMYRADGDRISLSMYAQKDMALASKVTEFLVERGIEITGGMPITLRVFSGPHEQYQGFTNIFSPGQESVELNRDCPLGV